MMTCYLEKCAALHYFGAIFLAILHDEGFEDTYVFCISCPKNSLSKHTRNQRGRTEEALMMTRTHLTHSLKVIAVPASTSRSSLKWIEMFSTHQFRHSRMANTTSNSPLPRGHFGTGRSSPSKKTSPVQRKNRMYTEMETEPPQR